MSDPTKTPIADPATTAPAPASSTATIAPRKWTRVLHEWVHRRSVWIGVVGTVATIFSLISLPLSLYLYIASQQAPLLTIAVYPLQIETHRTDFDNEFGFTYRGKPVDAETITSAKIAIWNAGTRSIRANDVLKAVRITMPSGVSILNCNLTKTSPDTDFARLYDPDDYKNGFCRVTWNILQPGDGAVIQLLYTGNARPPVLEGSIEGQRGGIAVQRYDAVAGQTKDIKVVSRNQTWIMFVFVTITVICFITFVFLEMPYAREFRALTKNVRKVRPLHIRMLAILTIFLFFGLLFLMMFLLFPLMPSSGPPMGW